MGMVETVWNVQLHLMETDSEGAWNVEGLGTEQALGRMGSR